MPWLWSYGCHTSGELEVLAEAGRQRVFQGTRDANHLFVNHSVLEGHCRQQARQAGDRMSRLLNSRFLQRKLRRNQDGELNHSGELINELGWSGLSLTGHHQLRLDQEKRLLHRRVAGHHAASYKCVGKLRVQIRLWSSHSTICHAGICHAYALSSDN